MKMHGISDDSIRERAYQIWEREGRPHGRDYDHWIQARVELIAEAASNQRPRKPAQLSTAAAKSAPAKPAAAKPARQLRPAARAKKQA
jgi:hypothetical protein